MHESRRTYRVLIEHFFRRFFDSDTVRGEGETLTSVVRAISICAAPGLIIAFFLQNQYTYAPPRPLWLTIQDQYFFVLFSFLVMGIVAVFEWEMLFPDRLDFLVLSPLSVRPLQMLTAKIAALIGFLALFLISANALGAFVLPAISKGNFFRQVFAHVAAVTLAGVFSTSFFLALSGVLLCVLSAEHFRLISPFVQMACVAGLVLLMVYSMELGGAMQALLTGPLGAVRWIPPLWFLGVYVDLYRGGDAPAFAHPMAMAGLRATGVAIAIVVLTYPTAWARMQRFAIEGNQQRRRPQAVWPTRLIQRMLRRPGERAVFAFITQTIVRNNRYQVYLAMYGGTGVALAVACATTFSDAPVRLELSVRGLHAVMPLLLVWVVAGLRVAFAFPMALSAGWVFRIAGVSVKECAAAGRRWAFGSAFAVVCGVASMLGAARWSGRALLVQAVVGLCLCVVLTDGFFSGKPGVPFNTPRMPGRTNLPLMLTLYIGVFPVLIYGVVIAEMHVERHLVKLLLLVAVTGVLHLGARRLRDRPEEVEEEMEGYEGEFQLLGLC